MKKLFLLYVIIGVLSVETVAHKKCVEGVLPNNLPNVDWQNNSYMGSISGAPHHYAPDVVAAQNNDSLVLAKFSYGMFFVDLHSEKIEVWIDDCSPSLKKIGTVETDDSGLLTFSLPSIFSKELGDYKLILRVSGDGTLAESVMRVMPEHSSVVVYDIDGTLSNPEFSYLNYFAEYMSGEGINVEERTGSVQLTQRLNYLGMKPVYLTARPYFLSAETRDWLNCKNFAEGCLLYPLSTSLILPTNTSVGDFKARYLDIIRDLGFTIAAAFGNSSTDLYAYRKANIPDNKIYMVGEEFQSEGINVIVGDYTALLEQLPKNAIH